MPLFRTLVRVVVVISLTMLMGVLPASAKDAAKPTPDEMAEAGRFVAAKYAMSETSFAQKPGLIVAVNNGPVELNSHYQKPMKIVDKEFTRGIAAHANSKIIVRLPGPGKMFSSQIGLDDNFQTHSGQGTIVFSVGVGGRSIFRSGVVRVTTPAKPIEVDLQGAKEFVLEVGDAGDGIGWDQAAWADARVELADGKTVWLGDLSILEDQAGLFSADPPFSFTYNGKPSSEFLGTWKVERKTKKLDEHRTGYTVTYSDPAGGLVVRCEAVAYDDFPTVEWTLYFKNTGKADTPILENIRSLDVQWQRSRESQYLLHHNVGSPHNGTDYAPLETAVANGMRKHIAAAGGRSTWTDLSYFNLEKSPNEGLIVVIGWPGQWAADFIHDRDCGIRVSAGQELTHLKLLPNEEIRTPLSVLQFWKGGDWIRSQNVWRRWMIAHNIPRPGGKLPKPMLCCYSGRVFSEMEKGTEENQIEFIDKYLAEGIKYDYWWMDAGWFVQELGWVQTGTWEVDAKRFPRGLKAVTDHAHAKGLKTVVWFEPERVFKNTWLFNQRPEWMLGSDPYQRLLNLGNPDALKWLTDHIDQLLTEQGIDLYRQDFNMDPLTNWRSADAPDRQGIAEIRHVEGLLAFWDELRRRHPDMLIDECASGGKRNDLEMMRRSVPLWRSDFPFGVDENQCMTYGISMWIPYHGTGVFGWETPPYDGKVKSIEPYFFWSKATPSVMLALDVRENNVDYDTLRRLIAQWREVNSFFFGDYYPLTKCGPSKEAWIAWQFDSPERGAGFVQAFRRSECIYEASRLKLRGLDPKARYRLTRFDSSEQSEATGRELLEKGLRVSIDKVPGEAVIKYQRVEN
jgi:alpha-galactosidase